MAMGRRRKQFVIALIPAFFPLRDDPRFEDRTRRLGLPSGAEGTAP
jgi:hypothetical protein